MHDGASFENSSVVIIFYFQDKITCVKENYWIIHGIRRKVLLCETVFIDSYNTTNNQHERDVQFDRSAVTCFHNKKENECKQ